MVLSPKEKEKGRALGFSAPRLTLNSGPKEKEKGGGGSGRSALRRSLYDGPEP